MATAAETRAMDAADVPARAQTVLVSIVIPCLNEERTIGACVAEAFAGLEAAGVSGEVVVCDNDSSDRTADVAALAGARLIYCAARGYGHAVRSGVEAARGEMILMFDGDGSYDLGRIASFLAALSNGADLVIGNRFEGGIQPGAMPWLHRRVGTPLLSALARLLFKAPVRDVNCGLRGFSRDAFAAMALRASGMELASEMIAQAAGIGLKIVEIPTVLRPDGRGRHSHLRPCRDGLRHLWVLIALRVRAWFRRRQKTGNQRT